MQIKLFTPPKFEKKPLDLEYLNNITNKTWTYSASGRSSIYHILKDLNSNKILVPAYICSTVLEPLRKLHIKPIFYDIDKEDLNPSLDSIKRLSKRYDIKVALVASMYGNPAALLEIEKYCKENEIFLIDDAAQSFGAKLDDRYIGTFGDAGFFSFSPGKPTAGHMGSFFWSNQEIKIKRTSHCFTHYLRWFDFYLNRYKIYTPYNKIYRKIVNISSRMLLKIVDIKNDKICDFEKHILGGILYDALTHDFSFRQKYHNIFVDMFKNNKYFTVIKNIRGEANNHKIVIVFRNKNITSRFLRYMEQNNISVLNGYLLLGDDLENLPNAKIIDRCIVELPIEDDKQKMKYLFDKVKEFGN